MQDRKSIFVVNSFQINLSPLQKKSLCFAAAAATSKRNVTEEICLELVKRQNH